MKGKNNFFTYLKEYIKSKTDDNYVLNSNSPSRMLNNRDLLIKTIKQNPRFIDELPEEILFKDDIYIKTATESGYKVYYGSKFYDNPRFISKYLDYCTELPRIAEIGYSLVDNKEIRDKYLIRAKKEKYLISIHDPQFLKDDPELALEYFKDLFQKNAKDPSKIVEESILTKEVMKNDWFMKEFISLCNESEMSEKQIIDMISAIGINLEEDIEIINAVFNGIQPRDIKYFFEKLNISTEQLKKMQSANINGNLKQLQEIAKYNPIATSLVDGRLLGSDIPRYKQIKYSGDTGFQKKLFSLSSDRYELFLLLSNGSEEIVKGWEKIDSRLAQNLSGPFYSELINSVVESINNGQELTPEEINILKRLLTQEYDISYSPEYNNYDICNNNIFNITTREELANYDNIKNNICKIIIDDPYLKNVEAYSQYEKYLNKFKTLEPIDRLRLALVEMGFDMNIDEAKAIANRYNKELLSIPDKDKQALINQARVIHYIINSNSIEELQQLGKSAKYYHLDFNQTMMLLDDIAQIVEEDIIESLYSPEQEDFVEEHEGVEIYRAPLDFETVSKFTSGLDKEIWDSSYSTYGFGGGESFRIATSMSYTTGEVLNPNYESITMGIGRNIAKYKMESIIPGDGHTGMSNSPVYCTPEIKAFGRQDIIDKLESKYNEVVVYTLALDQEVETYDKMQPEYFIYYQKTSSMTKEEREQDEYWKETVRVAKEFGVPIVIVDCEAIQKHEYLKINKELEKSDKTEQDKKRLVSKIKHYRYRYGEEEIKALISDEKLEELEKSIQDEVEEQETIETIIQSIKEAKEHKSKSKEKVMQEEANTHTR